MALPKARSAGRRYWWMAFPAAGSRPIPPSPARPACGQPAQSRGDAGGHARARPQPHGERDAAVQADAVDNHARNRRGQRIGNRERGEDQAILRVREMELGLDERREMRERLAVQIIDAGREQEGGEDQPAEAVGGLFTTEALRRGEMRDLPHYCALRVCRQANSKELRVSAPRR